MSPAPGFGAYRLLVVVQWRFLFSFVVIRMWQAGGGQGDGARQQMRLLALGAAGIDVQVVVGAAGPTARPWVALASGVVTVVMAGAFWIGLCPPSVLRLRWRRVRNDGLQAALADLVRATSAQEVASGLLPHVAAFVGASAAAVLDVNGETIASHGAVPETTISTPRSEKHHVPGRARRASSCVSVTGPAWSSGLAPIPFS